jgi:hypothetical protein
MFPLLDGGNLVNERTNTCWYDSRAREQFLSILQRSERMVEKTDDCDDLLTLANARNIANTKCEVNITRNSTSRLVL